MSSKQKVNSPILITGAHRSGSTWVGKMLSHSQEVAYIHEPFNPKRIICKKTFDLWYTYVTEKNELSYYRDIKDCLNYNYSLIKEFDNVESIKDIGRIFKTKLAFTRYKRQERKPLLKDPISFFSAEWLAKSFQMKVVILIRHPAAFAGSLKKADWTFPFDNLVKQPLLMEDLLSDFQTEIEEFANDEKDIVDQAILLWNIIHYIIIQYRKKYDHWLFMRHEDLSRNPVDEFEKIFNYAGINYTNEIRTKIIEFSTAGENEKSRLKRDSQSNIWKWKKRLTEAEIKRIKNKTKSLAQEFYSKEDW